MVKYATGDLVQKIREGAVDVALHGCNCFHTMGAGIARQLKDAFPEVYQADLTTARGDYGKMATWSMATLPSGQRIFNCYTQFSFGPLRGRTELVDYAALQACLKGLGLLLKSEDRIGMPWIGCGLAGGDRMVVQSIIEKELGHLDVTVFDYP